MRSSLLPGISRAALVLALAAAGTACNEVPTACDPNVSDCSTTDPDTGDRVDTGGETDAGGTDTGTVPGGTDTGGTDTGGTDAGGTDTGSGDTGEPDVPPADDFDGDGIPDDVEGDGDFDGDGIPNFQDDDSDGDGRPDSEESVEDDDFDDLPGFLDDDSDGDGYGDAEESDDDPDGDGLPNFRDSDSDGDALPDDFETDVDSDGDGLPDMLDVDSDNDNIGDFFEGGSDLDEDGVPNYLDLDSDADGHLDEDEFGRAPGSELPPLDSDGDRTQDFLDIDSDGDGLADELELGCPDSTERTRQDSDDDGFTDLLEVAFGGGDEDLNQACDPARDITDDVDFFFELNYLADPQEDTLNFLVDVRRADVAFNMDTTGSMSGEISALQTSLTGRIFPDLAAEIENVAYSFGQFDDFPCSGHGSGGDRPFILRQRVTTDIAAAIEGVNALERHSGGDFFESGFEAIYQTCTGFGRAEPDCAAGTIPPFDPAAGYVDGVADGEIGGVGFREGALPIIVHITDAPSHAKGTDGYEYGASRNESFAAMRAIGARLIGVASGDPAQDDLTEMAIRAGSVVPSCAWTDPVDGTRPGGCLDGMCCTNVSGSGRPPEADGSCPLVYDIADSGEGLSDSVIEGIKALINFATFDLTTRVRPDEDILTDSGVDTSEFVTGVIPIEGTAPDTGCAEEPVLADRNGDGVFDHFLGVVPGSQLVFDITAYNGIVPETNEPQVFTAFIDVVQQGGAVLDTQIVTVLVPPALKPVGGE